TYNKESFDASQIRVIGSSKTATNTYISSGNNLYVTNDNGASLDEITCPPEILRFDLYNVYEQNNNTDKIFLPTGANGIAFSPDAGSSWRLVNNGILNTSINLLSVNPANSGVVYASSSKGEGLFKSTNYGESWEILNQNGIVHQWADELVVDPSEPSSVWYISDVPYIHKSLNDGDDWSLLNNPYESENFSFSSVYAAAQANDNNIIYATNNGFGIFKGTKSAPDDSFEWEFLNTSDIDYTYTLAVEPDDENIIYSGYNCKPFEDTAIIRASYSGGDDWFLSLKVAGAEAVTSVEVDPLDKNNVLAASTGNEGILWMSTDKGQNWDTLNPWLSFTTIHSFAYLNNVAYAATWGGGMYKTNDYGKNWQKIEAQQCFSAADVAIVDDGNEHLYVADRSKPIIYKSMDGGVTWDTVFNAGNAYRRIMSIEIDAHNTNKIYASAMAAHGPGLAGDLFRIEGDKVDTITNELGKLPLSVKVSSADSMLLYAVLHESGVYKSINGGVNWTDISGKSSGLPDAGFNDIVVDPNSSSTLYLLGGSDVKFATLESAGILQDSVTTIYKSTNNGTSWVNLSNSGLGDKSGNISSIAFYNNSSDDIYLSTDRGVVYSTNGGVNWVRDTTLPYLQLGGVSIVSDTIIAYTKGAGLFTGVINPDNTISWDSIRHFKNEISFAQVLKHPAEANTIFASAYPGGIYKSLDYGKNWTEHNFGIPSFEVDDPLREGYYAIDINAKDPDIMYLGLYKKGVYRSFNGGDTWYPINGTHWEMGHATITSLVSDINDENTVYAGTLNGVYKTVNAGSSWSEFNTGMGKKEIRSLTMNPNGELHAGTKGNGLYTLQGNEWFANNGFGNWGISWPMWDNRPMYQYTSLLIHPNDNNRLMLGTFPQGIHVSEDGGHTWYESNIGWTNDGVFRLVCHPDHPDIVYAGTYNGLNISYDFGKSWNMADNGWPDEQWVFSIDFDPVNPDIMYACSKNGENKGNGVDGFHGTVMKSINGGESWTEITTGLDKDQEFYQVICDKELPNTLYLATQYQGVFKSTDGGASWAEFNDGLTEIRPGTNGNNVTNTLVLSNDNSMLYYGTLGTGVSRRMLVPILAAQELEANAHGENIALNWMFTDVAENFQQFNIYRHDTVIEDISKATLIDSIMQADSLQYIDTTVVVEQNYYYAVTVKNDGDYETAKYPVAGPVSVSESNNAPVLNIPLLDTVAIVETGFSYTIHANTFTDADGDELSYRPFELGNTTLPGWLLFDDSQLSFYGTPGTGDIGQTSIVLEAKDPHNEAVSDTFNIEVKEAVSLDETNNNGLKIYPVPAHTLITIETSSLNEPYTVVMYNVSSRKVISRSTYPVYTYPDKLQIDVSNVEAGAYVLVIKNGDKKMVSRVFIMH
ncbi:MAG: putative Ig domain-containing protein, partial [Bacteroidales bacterium]|nr:putative Ig domain-containing protein [Bacteroidales bacterium]